MCTSQIKRYWVSTFIKSSEFKSKKQVVFIHIDQRVYFYWQRQFSCQAWGRMDCSHHFWHLYFYLDIVHNVLSHQRIIMWHLEFSWSTNSKLDKSRIFSRVSVLMSSDCLEFKLDVLFDTAVSCNIKELRMVSMFR